MSLKLAGNLFTKRRFAPLFTLLQTGTLNDNLLKNALIALVVYGGIDFLSNLPSEVRVPVAAFIFTGPFLIIAAIAGQIADKIDRGIILRWVKRAEMVIMIIAAIGLITGTFWMLVLSLGLMGAQSAFFSPTKNAVLPQWLKDRELITGNALLNGFVFVCVLVGQVVGTLLVLKAGGPKLVAMLLLGLAAIGLVASEFCPPAPAPKPDLKINFEPFSATWSVISKAFDAPNVLRPMLGIAWFYGLSTVFVTTFPDYVASVMNFDQGVLIFILVACTISILMGSLITMMVARFKIWGPEAVGLVALGIVGVTLSTLMIYFLPSPIFAGEDLGGLAQFKSNPKTPLFLASIIAASLFNGIFVVPLQAMAQRRAEPANRARLMSAGAVLLNIFVNVVTFALIALAAKGFPPKSPFLLVAILSIFVAIYAVYRAMNPIEHPNYVDN